MPTADVDRSSDTIVELAHRPSLRLLSVDEVDTASVGPVQVSHFKIRLANTESRRSNASYLIERRFAWCGYQAAPLSDAPANQITLAAFGSDELPVATITVGVDSPAGLYVESVYPGEISTLRNAGTRLSEFAKLAVGSVVKSRPVLAAIFHIAYIYAYRIRQSTDLVIEVNPRHERF